MPDRLHTYTHPSNTTWREGPGGKTGDRLSPSLTDATIMMVDDEPITTEVIQMFLEDAGYRHFIATDKSTEALELINRHRPDVLLLDLMMPGVTGFDILRALRSDRRFEQMPVIMLTSSSDAETKLEALELGATDFLAKPVDPSELALRLRNAIAAKEFHEHLIQQDELTGLANRRTFLKKVDWALEKAARRNEIFALLHLGLKDFKSLNESHGLKVGDAVLIEVGRRLENSLSSEDSKSESIHWEGLARLGGDEFAVLLYGLPDVDAAGGIARRLLENISAPMQIDGREILLSSGIGIATFPEDATDADTLMARAATAVERAKHCGDNSYRFISSEVDARSVDRLSLETKLQTALDEQEFRLHYQPRWEFSGGRVTGVEALVRWQHPQRGLIMPGEFMGVAEETGLVIALGEWVLREACRKIQEWSSAGIDIHCVAVNLSSTQLSHPSLVALVREVLNDSDIEPRQLGVEMTETLLMGNLEQSIENLYGLQTLGIRLSIDHFGTGYFSLSQLKRLPLHELKIDREFFDDLRDNSQDSAIVGAIISMAHSLGLRVVAEGVETTGQLEFLQAHGCDEYQGYVLSEPLEADVLANRLREGTLVPKTPA